MPYASEETKRMFLNFKPDELGIKKQTWLFSKSVDKTTKKIIPPRYNPTDRVKLKPGEYYNKSAIETTLGRIVFNKICNEKWIIKELGFWNTPLDKNGCEAIFSEVAKLLEYKKVTPEQVIGWEKAVDFYSLKACPIYNASYTKDLLIPNKSIIAERDKYLKNNPNPTVAEYVDLEGKLTSMASNSVKDDEGIGLFNSGVKAKIGDHYKNISTTVGPVYNPATGEMEIIKSSLLDGFAKDELPMAGNMLISGVYPKSCATADSGYITKQYYAAFQSVSVDKDGSDCKTKAYIKVNINEKNWAKYEFQNMIDGDKIVTLTDENHSKYLNKVIKFRSPMCCIGDNVCSVCAGRYPYIAGITNIGITFATVPNKLLNAGMKKFHTSAVKMDSVDPDKLIY